MNGLLIIALMATILFAIAGFVIGFLAFKRDGSSILLGLVSASVGMGLSTGVWSIVLLIAGKSNDAFVFGIMFLTVMIILVEAIKESKRK